MALRTQWLLLAALSALILLAGCGGFGKVNQGRVVRYDAEKGLVTLILDSNYTQPGKPKYDVLPPVTVRVPRDRGEMGPAPQAGNMLALDTEKHRVVIFDAASQALRTVQYTPVAQLENVAADDGRVARTKFPAVDRAKQTITIYSRRQQRLVTFSVPDESFQLPDSTWKTGDEVRYYYKDPGEALRMMNISRTDLTKGK